MSDQHSHPGVATRFQWNIRVYYEDTDTGGVVFYVNYIKYFERARTELLRFCGADQSALAEQQGVLFVVRSTAMDYLSPARLDDLLTIDSTITRLGRASVDFSQTARRGDTLLAQGTIRVGCVGRDDFRPTELPAHVRQALAGWRQAE
jgi:acyl-CoA thioester hydrolase